MTLAKPEPLRIDRDGSTGEALSKQRVLATIMFTDIVDSTAMLAEIGDDAWSHLLEAHYQRIRRALVRFGGREINTTGDGILATFDVPASAIRCAVAAIDSNRELGLNVRAGVHAGECDRSGDDITGIAVHICARVTALAGAGEVLVSRTVKDLVAGSGLGFDDRGAHTLKGLPDVWQLFAVERLAANRTIGHHAPRVRLGTLQANGSNVTHGDLPVVMSLHPGRLTIGE
jgi:class 3 adenylate cyclase